MAIRHDWNGAAASPSPGRTNEVIYHIYLSSFCDSRGTGRGDLNGVLGKLDYIASLNVDAIWISPFFPSAPGPEGDGGYAVDDYHAIDPAYGTMDDFKTLLQKASGQGLRVYIDFVPAHTSNRHDWFEKSRNRVPGFEDYYVWNDGGQDAQGNRIPPNNWKSVFGGPAWSLCLQRNQWYLHHFLESQPSLNLNETSVQDAVLGEMKFWLDLGVDGFRLDALPFCNYDPGFRHNPWRDGVWPRAQENWEDQYFAHSMCQPQTIDWIARIRTLLDSYPQKKTALGEALAGRDGGLNSIPVAATYVDEKTGLDLCYTEAMMGLNAYPSAGRTKDLISAIETHFTNGGNCNAASNHDMARSASRLTGGLQEQERIPAMKQLAQLFMVLPGGFCLYQGEELGLPQAKIPGDIPVDKLRDPVSFTRGLDFSRDGSRTPMPWRKDSLHAGFTTAPEPWLPVPASHYNLAVDTQEQNPESMLNHLRSTIAWRRFQPAIENGKVKLLDVPEPVLGIARENDSQSLVCLFNMSARPVTLHAFVNPATGGASDVTIEPFGVFVRGDNPAISRSAHIAPPKMVPD